MGLLRRWQVARQPQLHLQRLGQLQPHRRKERVEHRVKNQQGASRSRARPQLHGDVALRWSAAKIYAPRATGETTEPGATPERE